jgi:tripartite-type tricarboxylate transporter receptor subunit TctC
LSLATQPSRFDERLSVERKCLFWTQIDRVGMSQEDALMRPGFVALLLLCVLPCHARADGVADFYRGKTINALVGVSPGGEYDFQLRLVARHLGKHIPGHPNIIAQNMTGATGMVMANYLYRVAPKDGTYIGLIQNGLPTSQAVGMEGVQFDAPKFNWIGSVAPSAETLVVWKTVSVKSIDDAKRTEVIVGSVGSSGITLSFPVMLNDLLGTRFRMVMGYTGSGALDLAMQRGEVQGRASSWSSLKASKPEWVTNREVSVLVHSGPKSPDLKDVPSLDDLVTNAQDKQVVDVVTAGDRLGHPFATSPGVPGDRVDALRKAFADMLEDPDFRREAAAVRKEIDPVGVAGIEAAITRAFDASPDAKQRARKYFQ